MSITNYAFEFLKGDWRRYSWNCHCSYIKKASSFHHTSYNFFGDITNRGIKKSSLEYSIFAKQAWIELLGEERIAFTETWIIIDCTIVIPGINIGETKSTRRRNESQILI